VAAFDATCSERKWLAVYQGGWHSSFTDRSSGGALNPKAKQATGALAVAFVKAVFDGDARDMAAWSERHAAILARISAVGEIDCRLRSSREQTSHSIELDQLVETAGPTAHAQRPTTSTLPTAQFQQKGQSR
jgi:hypothetical protein